MITTMSETPYQKPLFRTALSDEAGTRLQPIAFTVEVERANYGLSINILHPELPDTPMATIMIDYFGGTVQAVCWSQHTTDEDPVMVPLIDDVATWDALAHGLPRP